MEIKVEEAVEELLNNHLFNPTNKIEWINKLIGDGMTEEEAKNIFKISAIKYHASRNELRNKKLSVGEKTKKIIGYTGAGFFTFTIMPFIYLILVLVVIAILGFIFNF